MLPLPVSPNTFRRLANLLLQPPSLLLLLKKGENLLRGFFTWRFLPKKKSGFADKNGSKWWFCRERQWLEWGVTIFVSFYFFVDVWRWELQTETRTIKNGGFKRGEDGGEATMAGWSWTKADTGDGAPARNRRFLWVTKISSTLYHVWPDVRELMTFYLVPLLWDLD